MIRESQWARLREFQWLIIAVVIGVTILVGIVLLRADPKIACLEGGGTWNEWIDYCSQP